MRFGGARGTLRKGPPMPLGVPRPPSHEPMPSPHALWVGTEGRKLVSRPLLYPAASLQRPRTSSLCPAPASGDPGSWVCHHYKAFTRNTYFLT